MSKEKKTETTLNNTLLKKIEKKKHAVLSLWDDTKKLADKNDTYDVDNNTFTSTKPYESWTFDNTSWQWQPPIEMPNQIDEEVYQWNEENNNWEEVS